MEHIEFNCPWCYHHIKAKEKRAGTWIYCPSCDKKAKVPDKLGDQVEEALAKEAAKARGEVAEHRPLTTMRTKRGIWTVVAVLLFLGLVGGLVKLIAYLLA